MAEETTRRWTVIPKTWRQDQAAAGLEDFINDTMPDAFGDLLRDATVGACLYGQPPLDDTGPWLAALAITRALRAVAETEPKGSKNPKSSPGSTKP